MSLYLKYRPKTIDELDLKEIREFFHQLVKSGKVAHAYLFDGPRGAGKTSSARILAKMVNCESCKREVCDPCGKCESCRLVEEGKTVDLIEIDGASNRGIDDIRDLKERIKLSPSRLKKKVYIIDEVHMLTQQAFNALLKTLEEPPSHAIFILATTEFHKLPETIVSRCVRLKFRKASKKEMLRSLKRVVEGEKGEIEDEALELLAESVDGSFRDGVKILEQALDRGSKVGIEEMRQVLQGSKRDYSLDLARALAQARVREAIELVRTLVNEGGDLSFLLKQTMSLIKGAMLAKYGIEENKLGVEVGREGIELVRKIDETLRLFGSAANEELLVELMILEMVEEEGGEKINQNSGGNGQGEEKVERKVDVEIKQKEEVKQVKEVNKPREVKSLDKGELELKWKKVMQAAGNHYSLGALLSTARIMGMREGKLVIGVEFEFHKQQLETEKFRRQIEELVSEAFGFPLLVKFELSERKQAAQGLTRQVENKVEEDEIVATAEEIFLKS